MWNINDIDIAAIVTITDSGGSTGVLSSHFDIPAIGYLRRVIASLSRDRELLEKSMEYRISGTGTDLDGHAIGNLIIASQILMEKDFSKGIERTTKMLNVLGTVLPVSNTFNHLHAELSDGSIVEGEAKIGHSKQPIKRVFYKNGVATLRTVGAIKNADYIILGIGSLYTSLIANLIYPKIKLALKSTNAKIIYFANAFTQHGETDNMTLSDHIKAIE
ncbi:gluconeogenesis factor YvcK family protein [Candidatus Mycoplasma mahonii]|uniref:gluconeogenesis factor YvcK family protein n=1 Tax=Candidatus Mycoplasma mahonii TaxID=3004105 RepID=UPI0026EEF879|nr:gluconeogenesis factor YvcK family protein [Candidatus Mycoplasma mahonii]WKX02466.1 YvcK family protein [Candidatus Mycoplasma mahonii]